MKNIKIFSLGLMAMAIPVLSGCSFPGTSGGSSSSAVFLRSSDGGVTFEPKVKIDDKTDFASADVLSLAFDSADASHIYLGTKESGLFSSENSGDSWKKLTYPPIKVYGLVADAERSGRVFATGEWQGRGKMYRSEDASATWKEIYTEPSDGTVVVSLAQNEFDPQVLYAGTSAGTVIKTTDGGGTWKNVSFGDGANQQPILSIVFDGVNDKRVYFLVSGKGVFVMDGDNSITAPTSSILSSGSVATSSGAVSLAVDPKRSGVLYVGTNQGLLRSMDAGKSWQALDVIESSKKFPIRSVAINPDNSREITYASALALYKSTDDGAHWATYQLNSDKSVGLIQYDPEHPGTIYVGLRQ